MHITNQKLSFDIFTVGNLLNIFMEHDLNLISYKKLIILTHTMYCCLLLQIYLLLMTAFVLQGHIFNVAKILKHDNDEDKTHHYNKC